MLSQQPLSSEDSSLLGHYPGEEKEDPKTDTHFDVATRHSVNPGMMFAAVSGLILGLGIGLTLFLLLQLQPRCHASTSCVCHQEEMSPLLDNITIKYHSQKFNGSFVHSTIYRQDASPMVDAAWDALGVNFVGVFLSSEQASRYEVPEHWAHLPQEYGGQYVVNPQVIHHLHCLNLLRKGLYFNIDYYRQMGAGAFANRPAALKAHITHCLDSLRQLLMCNADVGVAGWLWIRNTPTSEPFLFPDFNSVVHQCRNFNDIRDWANRSQVLYNPLGTIELERPKPGDRIPVGLP